MKPILSAITAIALLVASAPTLALTEPELVALSQAARSGDKKAPNWSGK